MQVLRYSRNPIDRADGVARAPNYGYDLAGQLTSEARSGYTASYTYDANGNRLTRVVNGVSESYSYDGGDKLTAIVGGADPRTFSYDAAGRTTAITRASGVTSFAYDFESRITSIKRGGMTTNSYTYNGLDTRVGVVDSLGSRQIRRNGVGVTAPVLGDGLARYVTSGEVRGGFKTTFHADLKNADLQTSMSAVASASRTFDAFGTQISGSGVWKGRIAYCGPYGYQEDPDTGLRLLGHRHFDSSTGRFLTVGTGLYTARATRLALRIRRAWLPMFWVVVWVLRRARSRRLQLFWGILVGLSRASWSSVSSSILRSSIIPQQVRHPLVHLLGLNRPDSNKRTLVTPGSVPRLALGVGLEQARVRDHSRHLVTGR